MAGLDKHFDGVTPLDFSSRFVFGMVDTLWPGHKVCIGRFAFIQ